MTSSTKIPLPTRVNDSNKKYGVVISLIILGIVTTAFALSRLWCRASTQVFGLDDYATVPAIILYVAWTVMAVYVNFNAGVGKPLWEITLGEFSVWFKGIVGSAFLYPAMSSSIRISIILFYSRVFARAMPMMRHVSWALLGLQVAYIIVYSILPAFVARPLNKIWDPLERPHYMNDWYYYHTQVALFSTSMAFDVILFFLPMYPILRLQMNLRKRIGVLAMFMLGACVAAAYKLAIFVTQMERYSSIDPRWLNYHASTLIPPQFDHYGITFWIPSQVEPSVALIGTSLPALRPVLDTLVKRFTSLISSLRISSRQAKSEPWSRNGTMTPERSLPGAGAYIELQEHLSRQESST